MANNNNVENGELTDVLSTDSHTKTAAEFHPYHAPNLVHYGALAELVQTNPGVGSDGGTADCTLV